MKSSTRAGMNADQGARETGHSRSVETAKAPVCASYVSMLDRLIARMEVSRTYPIPVVSILSFWAGLIAFTLVEKVTGAAPVTAGRLYALAWLSVVGLELGRDIWVQRHRYASPRWLRAVEASVGQDWSNLLAHADAINFFTRPDPAMPAADARIFHVTITAGERSRELAVNDPFEMPELALLIRLTRRAMRDRLVLTPDMLDEQQLEAIRTAKRS